MFIGKKSCNQQLNIKHSADFALQNQPQFRREEAFAQATAMVIIMKKSELAIQRCTTMSTVQKLLGGKWKIEILYYIGFKNIRRFGELRRHIGDITESSLTKQLRELEADGFISRYDYKEVPPKVEYSLTDLGISFVPILEHLKEWGESNLPMGK